MLGFVDNFEQYFESCVLNTQNPFKRALKKVLSSKVAFFFYSVLANLHTATYKKLSKRLIKTEDNTKT